MDKFGLPSNVIDLINLLFSSFTEIKEVKIFGSRARGDFKSSSDIDLVLLGNISEKLLRHIAFELDELPTPYKFDVINYDDIDNPKLKLNIDLEGKVFYKIS